MTTAQVLQTNDLPQYGPYNGHFLADGTGLEMPVANAHDPILLASSPWTMYCWVKTTEPVNAMELVAGLGSISEEYPRYLGVDAGKILLWVGQDNQLVAATDLKDGEWHLLAATFDGKNFHLYGNGKQVESGTLTLGSTNPLLQMAPANSAIHAAKHFGGQIASFTVLRRALSDAEVHQLQQSPPDFTLLQFEEGSKPWPVQTRGQAGYRAPQDPSTLPKSHAPFSRPVVLKRPPVGESLILTGPGEWTFSDGWSLREAPKVDADGAHLSTASFNSKDWMRATVPGTVLTTMIDDGIYPDPDFGLNNMAIPESLNKQDYWYRNEFIVPVQSSNGDDARHVELTFQGINYKASVWLNGSLLGTIKGAFQRGTFDVTSLLKSGQKNVLAVKISPPPHPGIPQEQSVLGGPGENGGLMELDGPTFLATEGWDWIPAIRDRNSGIWQPVTLKVTHSLKLGDAQVVTSFPNHDTSQAAVEIDVPVTNFSDKPLHSTISATIEQTAIQKTVTLPPGESLIKLSPTEFVQLNLQHPRLWWPNGYGSPELYHLKLTLNDGTTVSDTKDVRFGVREITYELSLLDSTGHLRRVEYSPTDARGLSQPVVDVSHEGMREIPSTDPVALDTPENSEARRERHYSHVASIAAGAENSPSLNTVADTRPAPYLVIKVNGVRIAARGGNWGMDDSRKRVSRAHLEPYFRLNRDANLNIIRNWVGQSTEETFYDLADEYGMLVWNDFWESTQNYNIEAEDPALFLANAADTIKQFRNHPSIVLWCGRNEGVPQPILNQGLDDLVRTLDGTRYYSPSSNQVNLQGSGPYRYQNPKLYYSLLNRGFSVETGTPSMSTLESFQSSTAKEDQWPIGDAWAYHDWHQSGNGDVAPFMAEIQSEFGAPTSLEDFERKAQMLNYVDHRAIFEGMNANLWAPNSGRMLWMTQPAWPSTMWQILSSDYDTQASFYGTQKACEPLHVQLNLATYQVDVINTTPAAQAGLTVIAKVYTLTNELLFQARDQKSVGADSSEASLKLDLAPYLAKGMVIVKLEMLNNAGKSVSQNLYWLGAKASSYRELTHLAATQLKASATTNTTHDMVKLTVKLTNSGAVVSLTNKLTLIGGKDKVRILPAYYSDNYISLLPGESRDVEIEYPASAAKESAEIAIRGWNVIPQTVVLDIQK
ncbi:LamG-like jellyroll fold domain-containing protein [Granulicella sp. S190]|uniref:glycosyl hydrolase 2 galactose-binding domain-containing protein n=1 Tax=Granulicella sp. S190 TaxID=1747226 RepID=UPI001C2088AC|nr:LamG-like jellyroll fold domain-containing protein [Granulicella sp. S190]